MVACTAGLVGIVCVFLLIAAASSSQAICDAQSIPTKSYTGCQSRPSTSTSTSRRALKDSVSAVPINCFTINDAVVDVRRVSSTISTSSDASSASWKNILAKSTPPPGGVPISSAGN
ncbi:hypothetical protein KP509_24G007400 [Ceratopteris richardii]|uniref:Secreted protein n=1 Tax=Ceratopteris richardii TaxID=49495 RepID=A0A8T2RSA4_CERRI|nr:hypothetical protein KP509_24G007400 [Ceratopteris richardii]